jgi:hypothetical protein
VRSRKAPLLVALLALACSLELDWRELKSTEGGFAALMPAKPRYEVRALIGAPAVTMHLWSARAANSVFGVGYADYPGLDDAALGRTRDALVKNIGGHLLEERLLVQGGFPGRDFVAESGSNRLRVRLLVSGTRVYQLAVLGERNAVAAADIDLFLSSFQPLVRIP